MSVKGIVIDFVDQVNSLVTTILARMGNEDTPPAGDETLQRQHKAIEDLLAQITGARRTTEDIIPSEHTLLQMWTPPVPANSFCFDENGFFAILAQDGKLHKMNPATHAVTPGVALPKDGTTWPSKGGLSICRAGNFYAVLVHNMTRAGTGLNYTYTEGTNYIFIYDLTLALVRKITWDAATYGGLRGITWNSATSKLTMLTHKPLMADSVQFGFADYMVTCDIDGTNIAEALLPNGHTGLRTPMIGSEIVTQDLVLVNGEFFFPKVWFTYRTGSIHTVLSTGALTRILLFCDTGNNLQAGRGYYPVNSIRGIDYHGGYLYLCGDSGEAMGRFIAKAKVND